MDYGSTLGEGYGGISSVTDSDAPSKKTNLFRSDFVPEAVGKVETVAGDVIVVRDDVSIALSVGDAVYKNDAIKTGIDGLISVVFLDGTTLQLFAGAHMVLDEYACRGEKSTNAALFRIVKGVFGFIAGKMATSGRLIIETPTARVRSTAPGMGIGSFAFGIFSFCLVDQLHAESADIALLDDGLIDYRDLKHGVFEIITHEAVPRVIVVDDPTVTIYLRRGSSGLVVDQLANTPLQMAQFQGAYQNTYNTYSLAQQDPFIQQLLRGNAGPQSTGSSGSSTPPTPPTSPPPQNIQETGGTTVTGNQSGSNNSSGTGSSQTNGNAGPTQIVTWALDASGQWANPNAWSDLTTPLSWETVELIKQFNGGLYTVTVNGTQVALNLWVTPTATLDIASGGQLTVGSGPPKDPAGNPVVSNWIEVDSGGGTIELVSDAPATMVIDGNVLLFGGGVVELLGTGTNSIVGVAGAHATATNANSILTNQDVTISGAGTIGRGDGALTLINETAGVIDANSTIGPLTINTGNTVDNAGLLEATLGATLQLDDNLSNSGLLDAAFNSTVDFKGAQIDWTGSTPIAGANGILIAGTFLVDNADLQLIGGGAVSLTGGTIEGAASADVLDNVDNTISGYGTIGGAGSGFNLQNDSSGTIDSDIIGRILVVSDDTQFTNAGLTEANGAELVIENTPVTNTGKLLAANNGFFVLDDETIGNTGGTIAVDATSLLDLESVTISGGTVTNNGLIDVSGASAINDNASVTGGDLTVESFSSLTVDDITLSGVTITDNGTIDVTGMLSFDGVDSLTGGTVSATGATITVTKTLNLSSTTWNGGSIANSGNIDITGDTTIDGNASLNGVGVTVESGATLTLDNVTLDGTTVSLAPGGHLVTDPTVTLEGGASIVDGTIDNTGTLLIAGAALLSDDSLTNTGTIEVKSGETLTVTDTTISGGTLSTDPAVGPLAGGVILSTGSSAIDDAIINNSGSLSIDGGSLTLDDTTVNSGIITGSDGGELNVDSGKTLTLNGVTALGSAGGTGTVTNAGTILLEDTLTISGATFTLLLDGDGTVSLNGQTIAGTTADEVLKNNGNTISGAGQIGDGSTHNLSLDNVSGTIEAVGGTLTLALNNPISNSGTLVANGGTLIVDNDVTGTGSATIEDDGTFRINGADAQAVNFSGTGGTLALGQPANFTGHINGLAPGDIIDMVDTTVKSAVISGNTLTVTETDSTVLTYTISGAITGDFFAIQTDHAGGDDLVLTANWTGDTLVENYYYPNLATAYYTSPTFTVPSSGIDGYPLLGQKIFLLSVTGDTITMSNFAYSSFWLPVGPGGFNGFEIVDKSGTGLIDGASISFSNMTGLTNSDIMTGANDIYVNWAGLSFTPSTVVTLTITFDPSLDPSQVSLAQTLDGTASPASNAGVLSVADGTELALVGTIDNTGTINVDAEHSATAIGIDGNVTLQGGGQIDLSDSNLNYVFGDGSLINVDNTIVGSGDIGNGTLTIHNAGLIEAQGPYALIIDTGANPFVNTGTLDTGGGSIIVDSPVTGGGNAVIDGGLLEFTAASDNNVSFSNGAFSVLVLDQSQGFTGHISGYGGSDQIDLGDITYASSTSLDYIADNNDTGGTLVVSDGIHTTDLSLSGDYTTSSFAISNDGHDGTLITDASSTSVTSDTPVAADAASGTVSFSDSDTSVAQTVSFTPDGSNYVGTFSVDGLTESNGSASVDWGFMVGNDQINLTPGQTLTQSYDVSVTDAQNPAVHFDQTVSVSIGGAGSDNFVFQPGIGAETILNFNTQTDTIELDHFSNVQTTQQLAALVTADAHGDAVIDLGHNDSITLTGITPTQLHQVLANVVHLQ